MHNDSLVTLLTPEPYPCTLIGLNVYENVCPKRYALNIARFELSPTSPDCCERRLARWLSNIFSLPEEQTFPMDLITRRCRGIVREFDRTRGYGTIQLESGEQVSV